MSQTTPRAFHIMTKPIGPVCNLDCTYCFYLEKEKLYPERQRAADFRMSDATLEAYIRQYIESQDVPEVSFAWQGGEPTLMGLDFFRKAVALQRRYANGKRITNALQTNGTLLDEDWCGFFRQNGFLIGLSIDGPAEIHDRYRVDRAGRPSFPKVMAGLELLKKHAVEFNTLTVVNRDVAERPLDVYHFLKKHGSGFMQFIPLVERAGPVTGEFAPPPSPPPQPSPAAGQAGTLSLPILGATTAAIDSPGSAIENASAVTPWSVPSEAYGTFLSAIFDEWIRHDVSRVFVQIFDVMLGLWMGLPSSLCVFAETCGNAMAMEHNGDVYACDHYVYAHYKLGNILDRSMAELVASEPQRRFGTDKRDTLPKFCQACDVRFACNGECPKHRFLQTPDGEPGLNYLCAGYKKFLHHIDPHMKTMAGLLRSGRAPAEIMALLAQREGRAAMRPAVPMRPDAGPPGRNDPCPCGSGRKFKKCCGA